METVNNSRPAKIVEPEEWLRRIDTLPTDRFFIDATAIPQGTSYEWKRRTLMGVEDTSNAVFFREMGWMPVPADRHPDLARSSKDGLIEVDGMLLMERPQAKTDKSKERQRTVNTRILESSSDRIARKGDTVKSKWEPPIEVRLTPDEKDVAALCYPNLVTEDGDPKAALHAYEHAKEIEARRRLKYGGEIPPARQLALDAAISCPSEEIRRAGGIVQLAREIEAYFKESN